MPIAKTCAGRGTGGPRRRRSNATPPGGTVAAQLANESQTAYAACGSDPKVPLLAVSTSSATSPSVVVKTSAARPSRLASFNFELLSSDRSQPLRNLEAGGGRCGYAVGVLPANHPVAQRPDTLDRRLDDISGPEIEVERIRLHRRDARNGSRGEEVAGAEA